MIQARAQHWRGASGILGGSEHHDRIDGAGFIVDRRIAYLGIQENHGEGQGHSARQEQQGHPAPPAHPSKNSMISLAGMAPSRTSFHPVALTSTMVDGSFTPHSPPSRIQAKRSPSCSLTSPAPAPAGCPARVALLPVNGTGRLPINAS